jgi:hypothetical protein
VRRFTTRYRVRNARGEELVVPSLGDLHALYVHGFLQDDDLVRQERAEQWTRAGDFDALQGVRERRSERSPAKLAMLVAALAALAIGLGILLAR